MCSAFVGPVLPGNKPFSLLGERLITRAPSCGTKKATRVGGGGRASRIARKITHNNTASDGFTSEGKVQTPSDAAYGKTSTRSVQSHYFRCVCPPTIAGE
ncbi:unnamed protein product [Laminaria digitata]